jgi:immune inhibitor A
LKKLLALVTSLSLLLTVAGTAAAKTPTKGGDANAAAKADNLSHPLGEKQAALKQKDQAMVIPGEATPKCDDKVVKVAKGQYVELAFEGADQILTLVGEFGDQVNAAYGGDPGPLHNQIPQPDRSVDNTTIWTSDFSRDYYENMLFNRNHVPSMANWYLKQSSGRYTVDGYVSDWVQVPYNEANYGSNYCGDIVCARTWLFVRDQANAWWAELVAEKGEQGAKDFLASFDVWDRYDYNGNGNFNEPDGYIDHFQSIHAGDGEETGGGAQGTDAIWSHRWYAFYNLIGKAGPDFNKYGGIQIGDSGYWIGDYTVEPENGGVGVFAHEFGHDLGLPDEYDTSGNTRGAENGTAWWTNWSQGSYGTLTQQDLGSYPVGMTAWEKFQLGWLNYGVGVAGKKSSFKLGPLEANTKQLQGVFVVLPDKEVTTSLGDPAAGSNFYYSGTGDDLDTSMTRSVTLPTGTVGLTAKVRYNIEQDWDYGYLTVNGDEVHTSLSTGTSPNGQNFGEGITGLQTAWTDLTADLSAYAGQTVTIGFRYWTDGAQQGNPGVDYTPGLQIDEIAITGQPTDGAEADAGWTYDPADGSGFHVTTGSETRSYFNAYVAEFRQYRDYDKALETGPYNFTTDTLVEHFPYQDGLLIWYWDGSQSDNNVGDHPGEGLILPVDAHPNVEHWADGSVMRPRIQSYDATFSLDRTDAITLHGPGGAKTIASKAAVTTFDDTKSYWVNGDPGDAPSYGRYQSEWNSVNVPHTGTTIRIAGISAQGSFMQILVNN